MKFGFTTIGPVTAPLSTCFLRTWSLTARKRLTCANVPMARCADSEVARAALAVSDSR